MKNLKNAKRVTIGVMVKEGIHSVNNKYYLDAVKLKQSEADEKMEAQAKQQRNKKKKNSVALWHYERRTDMNGQTTSRVSRSPNVAHTCNVKNNPKRMA